MSLPQPDTDADGFAVLDVPFGRLTHRGVAVAEVSGEGVWTSGDELLGQVLADRFGPGDVPFGALSWPGSACLYAAARKLGYEASPLYAPPPPDGLVR